MGGGERGPGLGEDLRRVEGEDGEAAPPDQREQGGEEEDSAPEGLVLLHQGPGDTAQVIDDTLTH